MDVMNKLKVLADAAKYDVSCVSSGVDRNNTPGGIGNAAASGICHTWGADGRCISLLKILLTNKCIYDCKYCVNRLNSNTARASFTPRQVADLTIQFYRRNFIEGLFLSSAVEKSPNYTMENLYRAIFLLRTEYRFNGYIHVKAIPGADPMLVYKLGLLVDRMSVNLELPTIDSLKQLAPQKKYSNLLQPINFINEQIQNYPKLKKYTKKRSFVPGGQSTQFIVGASNDTDLSLLTATERMYKRFNLRRVFYSAYVAINEDNDLPALSSKPPLKREHRLYQADWLLRFYCFEADELLSSHNPFFDDNFDPKIMWAFRHPELFPIEINKADYKTLLRIPGIGPTTAKRIIRQRRLASISYHHLKKMKVVLKRAQYFITCNGRYYGDVAPEPQYVKAALLNPTRQMSIWGG